MIKTRIPCLSGCCRRLATGEIADTYRDFSASAQDVRTFAADPSTAVAVDAHQPEVALPAAHDDLAIQLQRVLARLAVHGTVVVHVVEGEEYLLGLAAAGASVVVDREDLGTIMLEATTAVVPHVLVRLGILSLLGVRARLAVAARRLLRSLPTARTDEPALLLVAPVGILLAEGDMANPHLLLTTVGTVDERAGYLRHALYYNAHLITVS